MENKKRGLSTIIVTLILVLLSLVLIGIVWGVVTNVVNNSSGNIATQTKCSYSQLEVRAATCNTTSHLCNVTVKRTSGSDVLSGVRILLYDASDTSVTNDSEGDLVLPSTRVVSNVNVSAIGNVTKVTAAAYFEDNTGQKNACREGTSFTDIKQVS